MKTNVRKMTISALLIALSMLIPIVFGNTVLRIYIPPFFTATLGAHVPSFISMFLGPFEAVVVGIGSVIGFLVGMGNPIIALRAASHIVYGYVGAKMLKKNVSYTKVIAFTAPIHGLLEGLVIFLFAKEAGMFLVVVTIVGTIAHHIVDGMIAYPIIQAIEKGAHIKLGTIGEKKQDRDIAV